MRLVLDLETHFDDEELRSLAFTLSVDYDSLPGQGRAAKARELVSHLHRRARLADLLTHYHRLRPSAPL